jgi:type IV secretion system protein VirD4
LYFLSRLILILAVAVYLVDAVMVAALFGPWGWCILGIVLFLACKGKKKIIALTAHGTGRWLSTAEAARASMLKGRGLPLGRFIGGRSRGLLTKIKALFDRTLDAKEACLTFTGKTGNEVVRMPPQTVHTSVFAPSGAGKSTGLIIPGILEADSSCVVVDLSGELMAAVDDAKYKQGFAVHIPDPYSVTKKPKYRATLNTVGMIHPDSATVMEESYRLSDALVWKEPGEMQPHFPEKAKEILQGLIAATVYYGEDGDKNLGAVDRVLTHPLRREKMIELMMKSQAYGGALASLGGAMKSQTGDEKASVLSVASRRLGWIRSPIMMAATATSSFDLSTIKKRRMLIGIVLPPERMAGGQGWLRSVINACIMACVQGTPDERNKVLFKFDEAAQLGSPPPQSVVDLLGAFRKYGLRGTWVYQALGNLANSWPVDRGETLLANTSKIFFGTADIQTAKLIESVCGRYTQVVESGGHNTGGGSNTGYSEGHGYSVSGGSNRNWGSSSTWQQAPRELLTADEILRLPPRWCITFIPNMAPCLTYMLRYWEEKWLGKRTGGLMSRFRQACRTLAASLIVLAGGIVLAMVLGEMLIDREKQEQQQQMFPVVPDYRGF